MTLTEYVSQKHPAPSPIVFLDESEIVMYPPEKHGLTTYTMIEIPLIAERYSIDGIYVVIDDQSILRTINKYGNPVSSSVFRLKY